MQVNAVYTRVAECGRVRVREIREFFASGTGGGKHVRKLQISDADGHGYGKYGNFSRRVRVREKSQKVATLIFTLLTIWDDMEHKD